MKLNYKIMRKNLHLLVFVLFTILITSSCNKSSGDDWTLGKIISLGDVSLGVPASYKYTKNIDVTVEVSDGFQGNSVEIDMEPLAGRTQDDVFNYKTAHYPYGTPTVSDTTLLNIPTRKLETVIGVAPGLGGEQTVVSYIFIHNDKVYTLEFSWSQETNSKSITLMNQMLASLTIK